MRLHLSLPASVATKLAAGIGTLCVSLSLSSPAQVVQQYKLTNLTSNLASLAPNRDANLVNPWGLSRSSGGPWWVSDNGTGLSTLYDGTGKTQSLVVTIPGASTQNPVGSPTGTVFNGDSTAFQIAPGKASIFLFVTEDGTISGWNPGVKLGSAQIVVTNKNAVYKGATIATAQTRSGPQSYLYVANFRSAAIEVYDTSFQRVNVHFSQNEGEDEDEEGGNRGFAPFNVQNIGGNLYVSYAKQAAGGLNEVDGAGLGFVNVYSPEGRLLNRLQRGSWFNAPWGIAQASGDFGSNSHDILVGQFGSGHVLVFDPLTGRYKGTLNDANNAPLYIDGLWALAFGNGANAGPATTLYFTAGPNKEQNGVFGSITAIQNAQGNDQ